MSKITFAPETVADMFSKVKGHSSIARLSGTSPLAFSGNDYFVFSMDDEVALVGENGQKPAGSAEVTQVTVRPFKLVYQTRISDEFLHCAEEKRLNYLDTVVNGATKKFGRGLDIVAFHGLNPKTKAEDATQKANCFDTLVTNTVKYDATTPDANIKDAVGVIDEGDVNGCAMSKAMKTALGNMTTSTGADKFPEIGWGNTEVTSLKGLPVDTNSTVTFNNSGVEAYVGDFQNALKWGYAQDVEAEIIEYGDPDGTGVDLKNTNQVCVRLEAYVGYAILDPSSFARITDAE